jgi:hypothetical protein
MNKLLASAVFAAVLALPLVANAQDGVTSWANAGGTDPARDLVGLGVRIFDRGHSYGPGPSTYPSSTYSSLARYELRTSVGVTRKAK